ncbi:MAG: Lrp/AsnC family transcriptional regulator, partial [Bifidobacteriaceae bacterium]|nr:Lrp/AsnC family transcriptional regulator [Bifidobacteriaceae bacterium]
VPIESTGRSIEPEALDAAAAFSRGFPFLIQMVGYQTWRQHPQREIISAADAAEGTRASQESMDAMILDATVRELSKGDLQFLNAMKDDPDFSNVADLAARLRISPSSAGQRRIRLIKADVIEEYGRGKVRFTLPLLREYLQRTH